MITREELKRVKSLQSKKFREQYSEFVVEGEKCVNELIKSDYMIKQIYSVDIEMYPSAEKISEKDLSRMSSLKTPNNVIAVVEQNEDCINYDELQSELSIVLCSLQNPGNMGTIIRTADWFGVKNIICSKDTVDIYNPKIVQATMGSMFRVNVQYVDLIEFFESNEVKQMNKYSAEIEGESIYLTEKEKNGLIILGNESNGVPENISSYAKKITIPKFNTKTESLNVSIAAGIILSEFKK
jgi:TrmH family RNA methyltransferase